MKSDQFSELVNTLLQKTDEKKVSWQDTFVPGSYLCAIEGGLVFIVQRDERGYRLTMKDNRGVTVGELNADGLNGSDPEQHSFANDSIYEILQRLYDSARQQAQQAANLRAQEADSKFSMAKSVLDRL